jgi:transposase
VAVSHQPADHAQKKSLHAAERDRPDVAEARRAFIRRQPALDPDHLVFIDETWAATNMARRYGRAARGLRLLAPVPHGHWKVTTLVAGLRRSGITAPCVFDGVINGERFRAYVEQMLAPTLRPDDIVLLDNLSSHKIAGIAAAITAQGAQLVYLPPYSPDLNPIRTGFRQVKSGAAPGRTAHPRGPVAGHRRHPRTLPTAGMPQLLYQSRLSNLIGNRSRREPGGLWQRSSGIRASFTRGSASSSPTWRGRPNASSPSTISAAPVSSSSKRARAR